MHWRAWGLLSEFLDRFGGSMPTEDHMHPGELARLMAVSVLTGQLAQPLAGGHGRMTGAERDCAGRRTLRRRDYLLRYLDDL